MVKKLLLAQSLLLTFYNFISEIIFSCFLKSFQCGYVSHVLWFESQAKDIFFWDFLNDVLKKIIMMPITMVPVEAGKYETKV